ncbi:MAG: hypothetical protein HKN29_16725 [Rhodothermales bacterium]|nr:hypothetical protein [Rhodothermales bacterium]
MARAARAMPHLGRIALLTAPPAPGPLAALGREEQGLAEALASRGFAVERIRWDAQADWSRYRVVVIRDTWDYHFRRSDFLTAMDRVAGETALFNSAVQVRWNSDKGYLLDLRDRSVRVVPTTVFDDGLPPDPCGLVGTDCIVAKPAVGASAFKTFVVDRGKPETLALASAELTGMRCLVQPFVPSIHTRGETSLVYFNGVYSHGLRKQPAAGDFRVQEELGGRTVRTEPSQEERVLARATLEALSERPLYARVDMVQWEGHPAILEVELIEPVLYLALAQAANRFAEAICERLG